MSEEVVKDVKVSNKRRYVGVAILIAIIAITTIKVYKTPGGGYTIFKPQAQLVLTNGAGEQVVIPIESQQRVVIKQETIQEATLKKLNGTKWKNGLLGIGKFENNKFFLGDDELEVMIENDGAIFVSKKGSKIVNNIVIVSPQQMILKNSKITLVFLRTR